MRLGGVMLNFCNVNDYTQEQPVELNEGNAAKVCLQLVDLTNKLCSDLNGTCYQRYIPTPTASLLITIHNVNCPGTIYKQATQDPLDGSIWCFMLAANEVVGSTDIQLQLTDGNGVVTTGVINNAIAVNPVDSGDGQTFC